VTIAKQSNTEDPPAVNLSTADCERIYASLQLIRRVEEQIAHIYPTDKIKSPVHLSIGQEAVAVGVCDALRPDDVVSPTYRGHAVFLAKGGSVRRMMAELYGKATGVARGKGGSMHLVDMSHFVLGGSAVVGTTIPVAAGYALALKRSMSDRIVAAFFGDGATEEGVFAETLNFAALQKLPLLFVCENNFYAIHSPVTNRWATNRLCERVATYGIPAHQIVDSDIVKLRALTIDLVKRIRGGDGPAFIECQTYRWREHVGPNEDFDSGYRSRTDLESWVNNDQIEKIGVMIDKVRRAAIDCDIERKIEDAVAFAESSPLPDVEALYTDVFATK
jgi:TPP-dependent pyruvate/acetoin dehydrogenase alpha subunit